jgi:predicted DNA-binding transcriptional regulator AlpA
MGSQNSSPLVSSAEHRLPLPDEEPRIAISEICHIAKISRSTVQRRIKKGIMPNPIDRGHEQLFDRKAVYKALGICLISGDDSPSENPWLRGARAITEHRVAPVRNRQTARD